MNLVGRIFIVLILVTSVFFMAVAMAVYATHKNWRDTVVAPEVGLQARLDKARAENRALADEAAKAKQQYEADKAAKDKALAKVKTELDAAQHRTESPASEGNRPGEVGTPGRGRHECHAGERHRLSQGSARRSGRPSKRPARIATPISRRSSS